MTRLTKENVKKFKDFLQKAIDINKERSTWDCDGSAYRLESLLEESFEELPEILLLENDGEIFGFFVGFNFLDKTVFSLDYLIEPTEEIGRDCLKEMINEFPTAKIYIGHDSYWFMRNLVKELGYQIINNESSYFDRNENPYTYLLTSCIYTLGDVLEVRDAVEAYLFPKLEKEDVEVKCLDGDKLLSFMSKNDYFVWDGAHPMWQNSYNRCAMAGFYYLDPQSISSERECVDVKYLCAIYKGNVIGTICFGQWSPYDDFESISYVDVSVPYRNQGIAKLLANSLESYLNPELPLYLTGESDMGKLCKMENLFKSVLTSKEFYTRTY